jgi:hypothetical protein
MSSECLVVICNPWFFRVANSHEYFQDFTKFIEPNMAIDSFLLELTLQLEQKRVNGHIGLNKFRKILKIFM